MRGSGDSDGLMTDEYLAAGARGRQGGHRVARGAALVQRQGRDDRQQLGRLQRAPGRGASAARAQGDHHVLLHRRPLRRRHALHGRHAPDRHARLGRDASTRCSARPPDPPLVGDRWREMWQDAPRRPQLHGRGLAPPPAPRRVLEARLGQRGLRRRSSARSSRSAAGSTAIRTRSPGCSRTCRSRGWASSARGRTRIPHSASRARTFNFLRRGRPLVRPLAQGRSTPGIDREPMLRAFMPDGLPAQAVLRRRRRAAGSPRREWPSPRIEQRRLGLRRRRATCADDPWTGRPGGSDAVARVVVAAADRPRRRRVVPVRHRRQGPGIPGRPARGRRSLADLRLRSRWPSGWRSSARPSWSWTLAVDRPEAFVAVRLCDVAPDGASTRASYGDPEPVASQRSHEELRPMTPGSANACACSSTTPRMRSSRATGSASPSRRPTGRWSGRRRSRDADGLPRPRRR